MALEQKWGYRKQMILELKIMKEWKTTTIFSILTRVVKVELTWITRIKLWINFMPADRRCINLGKRIHSEIILVSIIII